jgi:hypothetical protein
VLSGTGLCDRPIPRPEESYRLWCVHVRYLKTSSMRRPWTALGCCATNKQKKCHICCLWPQYHLPKVAYETKFV